MSKKVSDTDFCCGIDLIGGHCTTAVTYELTLYLAKRNALRYSFSEFLLLSLTLCKAATVSYVARGIFLLSVVMGGM
jgi:hypothetical protein